MTLSHSIHSYMVSPLGICLPWKLHLSSRPSMDMEKFLYSAQQEEADHCPVLLLPQQQRKEQGSLQPSTCVMTSSERADHT